MATGSSAMGAQPESLHGTSIAEHPTKLLSGRDIEAFQHVANCAIAQGPDTNPISLLDICDSELQTINEIGSGFNGIVYKVLHTPTDTLMARKFMTRRPAARHGMLERRSRSAERLSERLGRRFDFGGGFSTSVDNIACLPVNVHNDHILSHSTSDSDLLLDSGAYHCGTATPIECSESMETSGKDELVIVAACQSEHVVRCHGVVHGPYPNVSLLLEFMDAGSLEAVLRSSKQVPIVCIPVLALGILTGLRDLWQQLGVIHRDLKPSNVLLSRSGAVKLCDLGEAIVTDSRTAGQRPRAFSVVGTTAYMSPERLRADPYDVRAEVWALGVVLLEAVCGQCPFALPRNERAAIRPDSTSACPKELALVELWDAICHDEPPSFDSLVDSELADFVRQCLQHDPEARADLCSLLQHPLVKLGMDTKTAAFKAWTATLPSI